MKTGGQYQHLCKLRAREAETGRSLELSGQPAELNPLMSASVKAPISKNRWSSNKDD